MILEKIQRVRIHFCSLIFFAIGTGAGSHVRAQVTDLTQVAKNLVDTDTVAIFRIHLEGVNVRSLARLFLNSEQSNKLDVDAMELKASDSKTKLQSAGVKDLYLLFNLHDSGREFPTFVMDPVGNEDEAQQVLKEWLNPWRLDKYQSLKFKGATVFAPKIAIPRLNGLYSKANKELPIEGLDDFWLASPNPIQLLLRWSPGHVRVLKEFRLAEIGESMMKFIEEIDTIQFSLKMEDAPKLSASIQPRRSLDNPTFRTHPEMIAKLPSAWNCNSKTIDAIVNGFADSLITNQSGALVASLPIDAAVLHSKLWAPVVLELEREFDENEARRRLKLLARAIWSAYDAAPNHFLSVGTKPGEPSAKLGWRVHVLPFLGETELHKQFRLDEAWDSPHNKKLIERMPEIFRCPRSAMPKQAGRSSFGIPIHSKTMWPDDKALSISDIHDGTVNTVMLIELSDATAPIWTQPEESKSNLDEIIQCLGSRLDERNLVCFGDTSVCLLPKAVTKVSLRGYLTRSGGEIQEPPDGR